VKKLLQLKLKLLAKLILGKYHPKVIGITGSIGKSSTKEAVYAVLASKYNVRRSDKNYNNELGLPLTIIGASATGKNIFGWCAVILKALKILIWRDKNYPQILILEMGVDRPRDMEYLLKIVKPDIGIMTAVGSAHLEFFGSMEDIAAEKGKLIAGLNKNNWAILNSDDKLVKKYVKNTEAQVLTYGFNKNAAIFADYLMFSYRAGENSINNLQGVSFKVDCQGSNVPVLLPRSLGVGQVYAALAAISVGIIYGINLVEIANSLRKLVPPKGRMNLIKGIKQTMIIDDTYNASPQATFAALDTLSKIPLPGTSRRFAVLGDMLELGSASVEAHQEAGKKTAELGIDILITVGERARDIKRGAEEAGMSPDDIFYFPSANEAKKFVQDRIKPGDLILIKGSQGMRMERVVKEIMAEPLKAKELLVRQDKEWENK
jgi:UDP-N-acetylmuramoyl-tripeptide--D-alanyl-D-alanine ligase